MYHKSVYVNLGQKQLIFTNLDVTLKLIY